MTGRKTTSKRHNLHPESLTNATRAPVPDGLRSGLASVGDKPSNDRGWFYEIKWDGIRVMPFVDRGVTRLMARSGRDITREFPEFAELAENLRAREAVLDGEIVVLDADGRSNFQRLQPRFGVQNPSEKLMDAAPPTLYLFDVVHCDGYDLRRTPLAERKQLLEQIVRPSTHIRISEHQMGSGEELFQVAVKQGLEGIIGKLADSGYPSGRTSNWLKFKTVLELDAVVGGWTDPRRSRQYFGSLLVGLYDGAELKFIGGVGTGFPRELEKSIFEQLRQIETKACPFTPTPGTRELAHWVKPMLVARVGYAEWTSDRHLRQPRFLGLQPDRSAKESTFVKEKSEKEDEKAIERASSPRKPGAGTKRTSTASSANAKQSRSKGGVAGRVLAELADKRKDEIRIDLRGREVKLTHLSKVYFPEDGYTKRDVLSYYATVSSHLLPFLADRPLVLHRYPNGIAGGAFYQKESGPSIPDWIRTVKIFSETKQKKVAYFLADDLASLLHLTNLGCIEHNPFSARADDLDVPDYMFIDLDPTEGTPFSRVILAAKALASVLTDARLKFFVKTSGATGLHMFIPVARKYRFDQVRGLLEIVTQIAIERQKNLMTRTHTVKERPKNSVFVDVRQNAYAQSLASVFSIRPRDGAPVSTPVQMSELNASFRPEKWNIKTVSKNLAQRAKIWSSFWREKQTIEKALGALQSRVAK